MRAIIAAQFAGQRSREVPDDFVKAEEFQHSTALMLVRGQNANMCFDLDTKADGKILHTPEPRAA